MIEVTILIPIADNDGKHFNKAHFEAFESFALERFGGLSRETEKVEGLWADGGAVYKDTLCVYRVALTSITQGEQIGELAEFAKMHFKQEAIYLRYLGIAEII